MKDKKKIYEETLSKAQEMMDKLDILMEDLEKMHKEQQNKDAE
jgi:hypothetical protein|tara:strand:- start:293 stop:421 length:129 start_codon:yes stop_codon:yes gene_type:complete